MNRGEARNLLLRAKAAIAQLQRAVGGYDKLFAEIEDAVDGVQCDSTNFRTKAVPPQPKRGRRGKTTNQGSTTKGDGNPQGGVQQ